MSTETRSKGVSDVFKAYPVSVFEFLARTGQGLYIPAYQRPYSWDKANIARLIEDVSHGFRMLVAQADTVTFLGTIIAIHDTQHKTISPLVQGQVPARVMTIIDGQQRITTLLLVNARIHEHLRLRVNKLDGKIDEEAWLQQEVQRQLAELRRTLEEDMNFGDGPYQYYPRMIRSFSDQWSTKKATAKYFSPLAWYLHKYCEHARSTSGLQKRFLYTLPPDIDDELKNAHAAFQDRLKAVEKLLRVVGDGPTPEDEGIEVPRWVDVVDNLAFQQALCNQAVFPKTVKKRLEAEENEFHVVLRLLLFSRFVLTRVALTVVEATNEDSAFDLFEALNTTGEPLTAYETFKPKVIQQETLENFEISTSHKLLKTVDDYLSAFKKTDEKQDATRSLVTAFALSEDGFKLSRHLSDQRRYLRDRYEALNGLTEKMEFVRNLAQSASFFQDLWPSDALVKPRFGSFESVVSEPTRVCIDFLRQSNHTVTISPLIRFYSMARLADEGSDPEARKNAIKEFESAIQSIAAFWTLWRASRAGTDSIDTYYRGLMIKPSEGDDAARYLSLARRLSGSPGCPPNSVSLKGALRHILSSQGKIESKEAWVQRVNEQAASKTKAVTRFLLLMALHESPADIAAPGLNERGVPGSVPLLTLDTWRLLQTIEHIAPEKPYAASDWDVDLYSVSNANLVDSLGNLTLLPHSINSSVSNRSWRSKHFLYQVLSTPSDSAMQALLAKAPDFGVSSPTTDLVQHKSSYLAQLDALARIDGAWNTSLVKARGRRLAELAWDKLNRWLH
jgi:hypothetical protein